MSLAELLVGMLILGIIVPVMLTTLVSVQTRVGREEDRSATNDQARLAVEELDREIRSGNLLYDPANETPPFMTLRIYTQTNATTRDPGNRCVQWRLQNEQLERRDWTLTWRTDGKVSSWRVVADHIVNQTVSPTIPAFVLDPNAAGRSLNVTILVNQKASSGSNVKIQTTVSGRNTEFGYPVNVCTDVPRA
jgi:type II secretory pathway pseudopilin PulG